MHLKNSRTVGSIFQPQHSSVFMRGVASKQQTELEAVVAACCQPVIHSGG